MKRVLIYAAGLALVGGVLIFTRYSDAPVANRQTGASSIQPRADAPVRSKDPRPEVDRGQIKKRFEVKLLEQAEELILRIQALAGEGGGDEFSTAMREVAHQYDGDPLIVFREIEGLLEHPDAAIRLRVAQAFLAAGFRSEDAAQVLLAISNAGEEQISMSYGESIDLRMRAAGILVDHGVVAASDPVWKLYEEKQDDSLLLCLARLGDRRPLEVILPQLARPSAVVSYAEVLGLLRPEEAQEPLEKIVQVLDDSEHTGNGRKFACLFALFQITGDETYIDVLVQNRNSVDAIEWLLKVDSPKVVEAMEGILLDPNAWNKQAAFLYLFKSDENNKLVRKLMLDFLQNKDPAASVGMDVILMTAAKLNDPEIENLGFKWDEERALPQWLHWYNRRTWPIVNPSLFPDR